MRSERDNAAARHHKLLASILCIVKAREERKHKAADTPMKSRKVYDDGRSVTVEAHVFKRSDLLDRVTTLTSDLNNKILGFQTMSGLVTDDAQLRQISADVRNHIERRGSKLSLLKEVENEIDVKKKEVERFVASVTKAPEHHLS